MKLPKQLKVPIHITKKWWKLNSNEVNVRKNIAEKQVDDRRNKRFNLVIFNIHEDRDNVNLKEQMSWSCDREDSKM